METWRKIVLKSSDENEKKIFIVDEEVMLQSKAIKKMLENGEFKDKTPVLHVDSITLSKVIDYCTMHTKEQDPNKLKDWDANFVNVNFNTFTDLLMAATDLGIESLTNLLYQKLGDMIKEKSLEEICEMFKDE